MPRTIPPRITPISELLNGEYTDDLKAAYPDVQPPHYPTGMFLLCQLRVPKRKHGTIILADETRDAEKFRVQVALVRAMGPSAFKRRDNGADWPERAWCQPGDFVRVPMYGGDRVAVPYGKGDDEALFITIKDVDVTGIIIGDPLNVKSVI